MHFWKPSSVIVIAAALPALAFIVLYLIKRRRAIFDGLDSVVSFSSRIIAAARAVETNEEHALFRDPLARPLAGPKAYALTEARAKDAPTGHARMKQIGRMAIRTRWFDDQILAALGVHISMAVPLALLTQEFQQHFSQLQGVKNEAQGAISTAAQPGSKQESLQHCVSVQGPAAERTLCRDAASMGEGRISYVVGWGVLQESEVRPRQVVLLGAGMDSRPWRLDLPEGVRWFEVDRQDVLRAKKRVLEACDVQLSRHADTALAAEAKHDSLTSQQATAAYKQHQQLIPNDRTGDSSGYSYPLRADSWVGVSCDLCSPGWTQKLKDAGFDPGQPTVWVAEGLIMYLSKEEVEMLLNEMAGVSAASSVLITISITESVIDDIKRNGPANELRRTWKFGCPADPHKFLAEHGWQQEGCLTLGQLTTLLHLDPALCAFHVDQGTDPRVLFIVASVAARSPL